jgi:hypothetical protein
MKFLPILFISFQPSIQTAEKKYFIRYQRIMHVEINSPKILKLLANTPLFRVQIVKPISKVFDPT